MAVNPASSRLLWWAVTWAIASCGASVFILLGAWRRLGAGRVSLQRVRAEWRNGLQFVLSPYTQVVNADADKLILGLYVPPGVLGAYGAAYRALAAAHVPLQSLFAVTYPLSFAHGARGIDGARRFAGQVARYALPTGALASAAVLLGGPLLGRILGPGYEETALVLRWLAALPLLRGVQSLFADALTGAGFQGRRTTIQAAAAAVNVGLNLALDPTLGWVGATIATLASEAALAVGLAVETLRLRGAAGAGRESVAPAVVSAPEE